jgi:hypothetical protein
MDQLCALSVTNVAVRDCFPVAEELRMVRALTQTAWLEARQQGVYRAVFHGFRIEAVRWPVPQGYGVSITLTYAGAPYASGVVVVIDRAHGHRAWIAGENSASCDARLWQSIAAAQVI